MIYLKKQKRFFTILETLIAMSLLVVLLSLVFGFFREISTISTMTEAKQKEAFKLRYVESRLAFLFERVVNENASDRNFYFFIEPPNGDFSNSSSLIFTFNNEVRADPLFSGDVLGRLYVDKKNNLCLATWPLYIEEDPSQFMQKEVLMENVQELDFVAYAAPERVTSKNFINPGKIDPNQPQRNEWHVNEWLKVYKQMPSIIKLNMKISEKELILGKKKKEEKKLIKNWEFAFVLPSSLYPIYYPPN